MLRRGGLALAVVLVACSAAGSGDTAGGTTGTATGTATGEGTSSPGTDAAGSGGSGGTTSGVATAGGTTSGGGPVDPGPPEELAVLVLEQMSDPEKTMIASLQGILSRVSTSQIYVLSGAPDWAGNEIWLAELAEKRGIPHAMADDPWAVLDAHVDDVTGYILYAAGDSSINVASTLAGLLDAIPVEESIEATAMSHGLSLVLDVRGRDEDWVGNEYWPELNHALIIEAKEEIPYHLRDLAARERAMVFFDGTQSSGWRTGLMAAMDDDATVIGWGQVEGSENGFIINSGTQGVHYIPGDWGMNLSVHRELEPRAQYEQHTHDEPAYEEGVHYVSFIVSDGDNMQWTMNRGNDPRWWGNELRGEIDVGWTFPPHLLTYAPAVMDWYYDTASTGVGRDNFVVGPSGMGFFFLGDYPDAELDLHLDRLDAAMGQADMNAVFLLGYNHWNDDDRFARYLARPNIDGLFYFEWYDFGLTTHGRTIKWFDGKPVFSGGGKLFEKTDAFIAEINGASTDVYTDEAYTVVYAQAWEPNIMDNIAYVEAGLSDTVRVVTPEEIIKIASHFLAQ